MLNDNSFQDNNTLGNSTGVKKKPRWSLCAFVLLMLFMNMCSDAVESKEGSAKRSVGRHLRMQPSVIIDPIGFGGPMAAGTLFLPIGWSSKGGVEWKDEYRCTNGFAINWSAGAKDGLTGVAVIPHRGWEWNNYGKPAANVNCGVAMVPNVEAYLDLTLQQLLPKARKTGLRPREDLVRESAHLNVTKPTVMGQQRTWVEAGEISFMAMENGVEIDGRILAGVIFTQTLTNGSTGTIEHISGNAQTGFVSYAPAGSYNSAIFEAIRKSFQIDSRWEQLIARHNATIAQINIRGAIKRSQIMSKALSDVAEIRNEAWKAQQVSSDKRAQNFINVLREVQPFRDKDAPGGQVEFSNAYTNAWRLKDGSYLLTDDASFDPLRDLGLDGDRLQPE